MSYFDASMTAPERIGKAIGDAMALAVVIAILLIVADAMLR